MRVEHVVVLDRLVGFFVEGVFFAAFHGDDKVGQPHFGGGERLAQFGQIFFDRSRRHLGIGAQNELTVDDVYGNEALNVRRKSDRVDVRLGAFQDFFP